MSRRRLVTTVATCCAALCAALGGVVPLAANASVTSSASGSVNASVTSSGVAAAVTAGPLAAGRDYATDVFGDPWDYSDADDLLTDTGPTWAAPTARIAGGVFRTRFTDNGYLSPLWGGYDGPLKLGRDGAKAGSALDSASYRTVAFEAWSSRDVGAGLIWFACPNGAVAQGCGGGMPFLLKAGWHTYVLTPGASQFAGWPLAWGGSLNGLRVAVSPGTAGSDFALDWMRVVRPGTGAVVPWTNPRGGAAEVVWDLNSSDADNTVNSPGWGVLEAVSGTSGSVDLSALPPGAYRIGTRTSAGFAGWTSATTAQPLPRFVTPNEVGDRDYAATVLSNPWDMSGPDDVSQIWNAQNVSWSGGQLTATNASVDPHVYFHVGSGGIDARVYHNLTVTSGYDGPFDLRDGPGGGTMARVMWVRPDGQLGQTDDVLTYSGARTVHVDLAQPAATLLEPGTAVVPFLSSVPLTSFRWDPNEDRGARRWYVQDVQLRSDFSTTGVFPFVWQDAAYQPGGTATIVADTDRSGCDGRPVATGVAVQPGANTTVWNTTGTPAGRYWLCLQITRGSAVTTAYAGGVLVVGTAPPVGDPTPVGAWEGAAIFGRTYSVSGWAFDADTSGAPIAVDIYDTRPDGSRAASRLVTGVSRLDVLAHHPEAGPSSGFGGSLDLVTPGRHTVCAYAVNVGAGANRQIGCRVVDVARLPTGRVATVSRGLLAPH